MTQDELSQVSAERRRIQKVMKVSIPAVLGLGMVAALLAHPFAFIPSLAIALVAATFGAVSIKRLDRDFVTQRVVEFEATVTYKHIAKPRGSIHYHLYLERGAPLTLVEVDEALFRATTVGDLMHVAFAEHSKHPLRIRPA